MAKVTFTIHKAGKHQRHSRRNQILDAAQRCFKKQGFHKTTLPRSRASNLLSKPTSRRSSG